jgi:hypothetical protein
MTPTLCCPWHLLLPLLLLLQQLLHHPTASFQQHPASMTASSASTTLLSKTETESPGPDTTLQHVLLSTVCIIPHCL